MMKQKSMMTHVLNYIAHKRHLGCVFATSSVLLKAFGRYVDAHAFGQPLTIKLAVQWASLSQASQHQRACRLQTLRPFARYLATIDSRTQLIPSRILGPKHYRPTPYIYTHKQIIQLMKVKVCKKSKTCRELTNATVSTLIGLMACTGLRVREALTLQQSHIDWRQKTILVQWSKRLPMRLVPLDSSVVKALRKYETFRNKCFPEIKDNFFINAFGRPLPYLSLHEYWKIILKNTGVGNGRQKRPRIHDLRHTFACNHLMKAYKKNWNINNAIDLLSIYLGHTSPKETYWYLSAVPELLKLCSERSQKEWKKTRENMKKQ